MRKALLLFFCVWIVGATGVASADETFSFWPEKGAKQAPGFQSMSEHPCGEVARAKVSKLPPVDKGPLRSELVVELDANGKVIRRWPMPVDYVPQGLSGDELLVGVAGDIDFWIKSDGSFRRASRTSVPEQRLVQCDLTTVFGSSAYAGCSVFIDLASHKERTLGYQGVCS
jgi:hypothetical protein